MIDSVSMFSDLALMEAKSSDATQGQSEIESAARQFEAMLLQIVIKEMRKTVPEGMFASSGTEVFQDLFDQELSNHMLGEGAGLGLVGSLTGEEVQPQSSRRTPLGIQNYASQKPIAEVAVSDHDHDHDHVHAHYHQQPNQIPVKGRLSSSFGTRTDPITGATRAHNGMDIAAPEGTDIRAVRDGVVRHAGVSPSYGNFIIVDHGDGLETRYAHCSKLMVETGDKVRAGERIAAVGSTGRSTGPHLHLEVRQDGKPLDPKEVFGW